MPPGRSAAVHRCLLFRAPEELGRRPWRCNVRRMWRSSVEGNNLGMPPVSCSWAIASSGPFPPSLFSCSLLLAVFSLIAQTDMTGLTTRPLTVHIFYTRGEEEGWTWFRGNNTRSDIFSLVHARLSRRRKCEPTSPAQTRLLFSPDRCVLSFSLVSICFNAHNTRWSVVESSVAHAGPWSNHVCLLETRCSSASNPLRPNRPACRLAYLCVSVSRRFPICRSRFSTFASSFLTRTNTHTTHHPRRPNKASQGLVVAADAHMAAAMHR